MRDSKDIRRGKPLEQAVKPAWEPTGELARTDAIPAAPELAAGRVVHDDRGNAIWSWVKETSRIALGSTSRLLRRLEVPELKMEDEKEPAKSSGTARDSGGGYDPYNQPTRRPGTRR